MKEAIVTLSVMFIIGALIWNQMPTDDDNVVIREYEENLSTWEAGPEIPSSNANPEVDDMFNLDIAGQKEGPFDEKFALARQVLGPDGLFTWQGKEYTCLYKEELEALLEKAFEDIIDNDSPIQIVETIRVLEDMSVPITGIPYNDSAFIETNVATFKP